MELFYLIYKSNEAQTFSVQDLEQLERVSRKKNSKFAITGLLVRHKNIFTQYLEGTKNNVVTLYENILRDKRHTKIELLEKGFISNRRYPNWSMYLRNLNHNDINEIENTKKKLAKLFKNPEVSDINAIRHLLKIKKYPN